jgi:hypothetical protein
LLQGQWLNWLLKAIGVPLFFTALFGIIGYQLILFGNHSIYTLAIGGATLCLSAMSISALTTPQLREACLILFSHARNLFKYHQVDK